MLGRVIIIIINIRITIGPKKLGAFFKLCSKILNILIYAYSILAIVLIMAIIRLLGSSLIGSGPGHIGYDVFDEFIKLS